MFTSLITLAAAQAASPTSADLAMLCAGWAGKWRSETDLTYSPGKGWAVGGDDPNWSVEPTGAGKCLFRFKGAPEFSIDTTAGFYDAAFYKDGKATGDSQRGRVIHSEIVDPRAWNVVVEAPRQAGTYRMQMTMAGDLFVIYMTETGADASKLKPYAITVHRRVATP